MNKLKKIENYGKTYVKKFVNENRDIVLNDWYEGLMFFFGKTFFRGRKDEISTIFLERTKKALTDYNFKKNLRHFSHRLLEKKFDQFEVNNHKDRRMVRESIDFIRKIKGYNLTKYVIDNIKKKNVKNCFDELDKIYCIGHKLASLYLRDIVFLYRLEKYIQKDEFNYFQPVDTWVRQIAVKLKIVDEDENNLDVVRDKIIEKTLKSNVSPLLFNAGAWLVGTRSVELLLGEL